MTQILLQKCKQCLNEEDTNALSTAALKSEADGKGDAIESVKEGAETNTSVKSRAKLLYDVLSRDDKP